ncbi:hypothetical protein [Bradyrhizobium sp. USDA 4473]
MNLSRHQGVVVAAHFPSDMSRGYGFIEPAGKLAGTRDVFFNSQSVRDHSNPPMQIGRGDLVEFIYSHTPRRPDEPAASAVYFKQKATKGEGNDRSE